MVQFDFLLICKCSTVLYKPGDKLESLSYIVHEPDGKHAGSPLRVVTLVEAEQGALEDGGGVGKLVQGQEQSIRAGFFGAKGASVFF